MGKKNEVSSFAEKLDKPGDNEIEEIKPASERQTLYVFITCGSEIVCLM